MEGHEGKFLLPLSYAEAQELLARLLLSHDDDNDLSAALMKRLAGVLEGKGSMGTLPRKMRKIAPIVPA
jgi:hypothetical protein